MLKIKSFTFNDFEENTYLIYDETKECAIIDAGCSDYKEEQEIFNFIADNELIPKLLINTHLHFDHFLGALFLQSKFSNISMFANKEDEFLLKSTLNFAYMYDLQIKEIPQIGKYLKDNNVLTFGNTKIKVLETPGHSPGGLCFYIEQEKVIFTGDSLFYQTIGRTDLPGGDYQTLINSIKNKILCLPDETTIYPGHGMTTKVEIEKSNSFFV